MALRPEKGHGQFQRMLNFQAQRIPPGNSACTGVSIDFALRMPCRSPRGTFIRFFASDAVSIVLSVSNDKCEGDGVCATAVGSRMHMQYMIRM